MKQYQGLLWSTPAAATGDSSLHLRQLSFSHCTHILFTNSLLPRAGPIGMVLIIRLACCFILFWFRFVFVLFCFSEVNPIWKINKKYGFKGTRSQEEFILYFLPSPMLLAEMCQHSVFLPVTIIQQTCKWP